MSYQAKWKEIKATNLSEIMIQTRGNFALAGRLLNTHKDVVAKIYKEKRPHAIIDFNGGMLLVTATPNRVKALL